MEDERKQDAIEAAVRHCPKCGSIMAHDSDATDFDYGWIVGFYYCPECDHTEPDKDYVVF